MTTDLPPVHLDPPGRGRIYESILDTVGNTPLIRVRRFAAEEGVVADLLLKLEFFNPAGSVKDRVALGMIVDMENEGRIEPGKTTLVEPTSGNTGIGLAFVAASRGYKLILIMPESMSVERRKMLTILGAQVELTPREKGMGGAIEKANELLATIPGSVMPGQFDNPSNPAIHERTTAEEIWKDTEGQVDYIVSGVGTGGTFTGCARTLKPRRPELKMIAVEPDRSPVLAGGQPGPHIIQGLGAGFIPANMDVSYIDEIVQVSNERALELARRIAQVEGVPVGISSGAALAAAIEVGRRPEAAGRKLVAIIPSFAERYLSTALFDGLG
jgi:cysteine synthase A